MSIEQLTTIHRVSKFQTLLAKAASHSITDTELKYLHTYRPESEFQEGFSHLRRLQSKQVTLEHCLCLALMAYTNMAFNVMQFGPLWQRLREGLAHAVLEYGARDYEEECLVWTMTIAVWSWDGRLGLEGPGRRILHALQADHPNSRIWVDLKESLRDFLWTDKIEKQLQRYWLQ